VHDDVWISYLDRKGPLTVGIGAKNDRIDDKHNAAYECNMAQFILDVRRDLGVEKLPFVIAETGMGGPEEKHPRAR